MESNAPQTFGFFTDRNGTTWNLNLNYGMILDLKDQDIDVDDILNAPEKFAALILATPQKFIQMLAFICNEQMVALQVEPRQFARIFDRETIDKATQALIEALVSFYPRGVVGKSLAGRIPQMLQKLDQDLANNMESVLSEKGLNSADQLESMLFPESVPTLSGN